MIKTDIQDIILNAIEMANHIREEDNKIPVSISTELYGQDGYLDSMGLVAILIDIEELFLDEDIQLSLSDERAMSQSKSPFRDVQTLTDYIAQLLKEVVP